MLEALAVPGEWEFSQLVNYQLIASGAPFPYADLAFYDVVLYSPIDNKGDYNTHALRAHCASVGCRAICYPWLEWHGYCPGAYKSIFKGRQQWFYPGLVDIAAGFGSFDRFVSHVFDAFPDDATIDRTLEMSTARLRSSEDRHATDVRVADHIADTFRVTRLFLISDHAALALYLHVIDQIIDMLGLETVSAAPAWSEPQWQFRTPIMPRVGCRLKLEFEDGQWADHEVLPGISWDLQTYLALYFYADSVIMGPVGRAEILDRARLKDAAGRVVEHTTRLLAQPLTPSRSDEIVDYELLKDLPGPPVTIAAGARFSVRSSEWRTSWLA